MKASFEATVTGLRTEAAVAAGKLEESRATIMALQSKQSSSNAMEPKGLQKPINFNNKKEGWTEFAFRYENWMMGFQGKVKPFLRWAENQPSIITSNVASGSFG